MQELERTSVRIAALGAFVVLLAGPAGSHEGKSRRIPRKTDVEDLDRADPTRNPFVKDSAR